MLNILKGLLFSGLVFSSAAASADLQSISQFFVQQTEEAARESRALNWIVGDQGNYNVAAGFIKGTMVMLVRERTTEGFWVQQDLDLGFAGKQKVEMLIDSETGEVKKVLVNGEVQETPKNDSEVIEVTQTTVTVPAGTFDCLYVLLKDSEGKESKAWVNPNLIPITGLLKNLAPSQLGEVTVELTSFKKN